ncbi:MAG: hypothetical protein LQ341_006770, partial [Variospora aurantia]
RVQIDDMRFVSEERGTRAAGWFDDFIQDRKGSESVQSLVLEGGITGWANAGPDYVAWMVDYDADFWQKPKESRSKA